MKKKRKSVSYAKWGYIFILPFFICFLIFSLIPLIDTVRYSFFEYYRSGIKEIGPNFIGMQNYISLLGSDMLKYAGNTLILWVIDCCGAASCKLVYGYPSEDQRQAVL